MYSPQRGDVKAWDSQARKVGVGALVERNQHKVVEADVPHAKHPVERKLAVPASAQHARTAPVCVRERGGERERVKARVNEKDERAKRARCRARCLARTSRDTARHARRSVPFAACIFAGTYPMFAKPTTTASWQCAPAQSAARSRAYASSSAPVSADAPPPSTPSAPPAVDPAVVTHINRISAMRTIPTQPNNTAMEP